MQQTVCLTLVLGFLPALVLAWYHGEKGRQQMTVSGRGQPKLMVMGCGAFRGSP